MNPHLAEIRKGVTEARGDSRQVESVVAGPLRRMTSQGSASGRFTRAIQQRNLFMAEIALKEMGTPEFARGLGLLASPCD